MSIPLPAPAIRLHGKRGKQISPELIGFFDDGQMHAHAAAVTSDKDAEIAGLREELDRLRQVQRSLSDKLMAERDRIKVLEDALRDTLDFVERHSHRWDGLSGKHPFLIVEAARAALGDKGID